MSMRNKVLICVISLMTMCISAAYAQNKESKIFCPELNDTVAIERTGRSVRVFIIGDLKTFKEYDRTAIQTNYKYEKTPFEKATKEAFQESGGRTKVRSILFDKYGLRHGGGFILYFSNSGTIEAISVIVSKIKWLDADTYSDKMLLSLFLDFRENFIFPAWENKTEYASLTFMI